MFHESGVNLFQVGAQGREMQIAFQATAKLFSTEKFSDPYILEGEVRTYNQQMLEHFEVRSQLLFFLPQWSLRGLALLRLAGRAYRNRGLRPAG